MAAGVGVVGRTAFALRYQFESGGAGEVMIAQDQILNDMQAGPLRAFLAAVDDDVVWSNLNYSMRLNILIQPLPAHNSVIDSAVGPVGAAFTIAPSLARVLRIAAGVDSIANVELRFNHSIDR